jgi:hypothetical protein
LQCAWLTGDPLKAYFADEMEKHHAVLKEMGEAQ